MYISTELRSYNKEQESKIHQLAEAHKVHLSLIPSVIENNFFKYELDYIETQPILVRSKFPLDFLTNIVIKRTFDLVFSVFVL